MGVLNVAAAPHEGTEARYEDLFVFLCVGAMRVSAGAQGETGMPWLRGTTRPLSVCHTASGLHVAVCAPILQHPVTGSP